jgi:hypothetical protein
MNKAIKNKWVKALRSGKYKQAEGTLYNKDKDSFCCLGVLKDLQGGQRKYSASLLGCKYSCGINKKTMRCLAEKNDNGWSFKLIANWIEKNL